MIQNITMWALLYLFINCNAFEDSDSWNGPTTFEEFKKFHEYPEKNNKLPELQATVCEYNESIDTYICFQIR